MEKGFIQPQPKEISASKSHSSSVTSIDALTKNFGELYQEQQWSGLQSIIVVERIRHLWNQTTYEIQYYLSSLPPDAQLNGRVIRQHWGIENQLHWSLDVTWREDQCRIHSFHSPRNFTLLRRIALNALHQETTLKRSLRQKVKRATMNNDYMMQILKCFCQD